MTINISTAASGSLLLAEEVGRRRGIEFLPFGLVEIAVRRSMQWFA
jgi:hypothetical protein